MSSKLHWGLIGTGNIARQFAAGVLAGRRCELACVGSRTGDSAQAFARTFGIAHAFANYDAVIDDSSADAIYIALPNSLHHRWTIRALQAGKHVLCEKPIASNATEAQEMFDVAQRTGRILVEAFMYRAHPLTAAVLRSVREGAAGRVRIVRSSFCYRTRRTDGNIRFDAQLAGGALMDIGCYCVDFSRLIAGGEPIEIRAIGHWHSGGVDEFVVGFMRFPGDLLASFTCGMTVQADNTAHICGDEGYIEIPVPWKPPQQGAAYTIAHGTPPRMDRADSKSPPSPPRHTHLVDAGIDVFGVEADDFAATVLDGKPPMLRAADSIGNMRVLDEMRRQVGTL